MYLSNKWRILFIHIPKSGGTSIATGLLNGSGDNVFRSSLGGSKHLDMVQLKKYMRRTNNGWFNIDNYYKTAFVRNPFDRLLSGFMYLKHREERPDLINLNFTEYCRKIDKKKPTKTHKYILKPQLDYIVNEGGQIITDFIGRFENIEEDFQKMCNNIGRTDATLPKKNSTEHKNYREYYDDYSKQLVEDIFYQDLKEFNYKF